MDLAGSVWVVYPQNWGKEDRWHEIRDPSPFRFERTPFIFCALHSILQWLMHNLFLSSPISSIIWLLCVNCSEFHATRQVVVSAAGSSDNRKDFAIHLIFRTRLLWNLRKSEKTSPYHFSNGSETPLVVQLGYRLMFTAHDFFTKRSWLYLFPIWNYLIW
jgi:hypothetical protein